MTPDLTEIAKEKVSRFTRQFGEPHRKLAYYAALPLILTPELLNYLRNHFLRGEVPWVAEADLLLSELCRPVGYEQFAFDPEVRAYLIGQMREQIGETAMEETARLLIRYVHQLSRTTPHLSRDSLQAEQWSAMVFLKEKREDAVIEITKAFRDHLLPAVDATAQLNQAIPQTELARLVRITHELAAQLDEYPDLLRYASDVARLLAQPSGLMDLAKSGRGSDTVVRVAGVELPDIESYYGSDRQPLGIENQPVFATPDGTLEENTHAQNVNSHIKTIWHKGRSKIKDMYDGYARRLMPDYLSDGLANSITQNPTIPKHFRDLFLTRMEDGSMVKDETQPGPAMVWLPGGTFLMGSPEGVGNNNERPQHEVTLGHYAVGQYPVTVGEFRRFVEETGYRTEAEQGDGAYVWDKKGEWKKTQVASWRNPYFEQADLNPVVCLSWNDAKAYCDWLSEKTGQAYSLLTEAKWEYACRAGSDARYGYGDDKAGLGDYAWYSNNANSQTHPVGQKKPNTWHLYDLHGNVWEWCADWYADDYYQQFASVDPIGPESGSGRIVRGGSWYQDSDYCRSAFRYYREPSLRLDSLGFRLSRTGPLSSYPFPINELGEDLPAIAKWRRLHAKGVKGQDMLQVSVNAFETAMDNDLLKIAEEIASTTLKQTRAEYLEDETTVENLIISLENMGQLADKQGRVDESMMYDMEVLELDKGVLIY